MNNNLNYTQMQDPYYVPPTQKNNVYRGMSGMGLTDAVSNRADRIRQLLEPADVKVSQTGNTYTTHNIIPRYSFEIGDGLNVLKDKLMLWKSIVPQGRPVQFGVRTLVGGELGEDGEMVFPDTTTYTISAFAEFEANTDKVVEWFENQQENYEEDAIDPMDCEFFVVILEPVAGMVGMGAARSHKQATNKWFVYSPESFANCFYHAVILTRSPDKLRRYLEGDNVKLVQAARDLKRHINPANKTFSDDKTIQHVCDYIKTDIVIHDNLYILHKRFKPAKYPQKRKDALEIRYTNRNHFEALIRWSAITEDNLIQELKTPAVIEPLDTSENETISKHKIRKKFFDKIGSWDIETWCDPNGNFRTYAIGVGWMDGDVKEYQSFWGEDSPTRFFQYLEENSETFDGMYLYSHNGGKFDTLNVMKVLMESTDWRIDSTKYEMIDLEGCIISMAIYNSKGHFIHFRDSCALIPGALKKLCKDFEVGADTKGEADHEDIEKHINNHGLIGLTDKFPTLYEYLRCDVHGLLEIMLKYNKEVYDLTYVKKWKTLPAGGVSMVNCLTSASFAKKLFFQKYFNKNICMLTDTQDTFIRGCYGGGRTEVFQLGEIKKKLWYLDFTSLYPSVCDKHPLPSGKPEYVPQFKAIQPYSFIRCMVRSTELGMTKKPLHYIKDKGKMIFPHLGDWTEMTLYSGEMLYGRRKKLYEYELLDGYRFPTGRRILQKYMVDGFANKAAAKKAGKAALAQAHKLNINTLYGSFGLNPKGRDSVKIIDDPTYNPSYVQQYIEKGQLINEGAYKGYIQLRLKKDINVKDFNVSIAAAISAMARVRITSLIHDIEDTGKRVFYCDTDSVITDCDVVNVPHLQEEYMWDRCGDDLGSLKNEGDDELGNLVKAGKMTLEEKVALCKTSVSFDSLIIFGAKFYSLAGNGIDISKCKGRKKSKKTEAPLDHSMFQRALHRGEIITQNQEQFRCGKNDWLCEKNPYQMRKVVVKDKTFKMQYRKGKIEEDLRITPFVY